MTAIWPARTIEARLVAYRWAWAHDQAGRIAAHWAERVARQPAMFDGQILMVCDARRSDGRLDLDLFATSYSTMLAHLDWGSPDPSVRNGFAMGALTSRDGAFLLGVMAPHTAPAGRMYFAAGTPDLADVRPDGSVDLAGSILREIREETGLAVRPEHLATNWTVVEHGGRAALMRGVALDHDADTLRTEILAHLAREAEPELSDVVVVRSEADIDEARMPEFLPAYLRHAFAEARRGSGQPGG